MSLYGEVQKEVIEATLAGDYGLEVEFRESTTICIERPVGSGAAFELIGKEPNPFLATVGLRVDPAPAGGVAFRLEVELGSMPFSFFKAVEETVHETLGQGLYGWQVTDCTVTMTHSGYWARQSHAHATFDKSMSSTAGDFRNLTPLVLMDALARAGTRVHEPMHRFRLEIPADTLGAVLPVLGRLRAVPGPPPSRGRRACWRARSRRPGSTSWGSGYRRRRAARGCWRAASSATSRSGARSRPAPDRPQPARPQGVPAAGHAAGRRVRRSVDLDGLAALVPAAVPADQVGRLGLAAVGAPGVGRRQQPGVGRPAGACPRPRHLLLRESPPLIIDPFALAPGGAGRPRHGMPGRPTDKWTG